MLFNQTRGCGWFHIYRTATSIADRYWIVTRGAYNDFGFRVIMKLD